MLKDVVVRSTGHYAPARVMKNEEFSAFLETNDAWITERTGIKERRYAAPGETVSDMALAASKIALERAGVSAEDVDLIIVPTVTPDTVFPATANWLQGKLGNKKAWSFDVNAGCSGFIYAISAAHALLASGQNRYALVVGAEKMTALCDFTDRAVAVLFGDGAACFLLEAVDPADNPQGFGLRHFHHKSDGSLAPILMQHAGGSNKPSTYESVAAHEHFIYMEGQEVYKNAVRRMSETVREVLQTAGKTADDVDYFIPHQANARIIEAVTRMLRAPAEKVYVNVNRFGNTTSATIPLCVDELYEAGKLHDGSKLVLFTFGTGFTWGACYMVWGSPK
jgi:3-oxoacyl-[acyl-carrier-protein] synthase III